MAQSNRKEAKIRSKCKVDEVNKIMGIVQGRKIAIKDAKLRTRLLLRM